MTNGNAAALPPSVYRQDDDFAIDFGEHTLVAGLRNLSNRQVDYAELAHYLERLHLATLICVRVALQAADRFEDERWELIDIKALQRAARESLAAQELLSGLAHALRACGNETERTGCNAARPME